LSYEDQDFAFRRKMIKNIPYFRNLNQDDVNSILAQMRPRRYAPGTIIVKKGYAGNLIFLLKSGQISVQVPSSKCNF